VYGVAIHLVELTPSVLAGPNLLLVFGGHSLGLPGLVGLLLPLGLFLFRRLMYPYGLRSTWSSWLDEGNASTLLSDFPFCDDVGYRSTPDLTKGLGVTPDE